MAPNMPATQKTARKAPAGSRSTPIATPSLADKRPQSAQTPEYQHVERISRWVMDLDTPEAPKKRKRRGSVTSKTSIKDEDESPSESEQADNEIAQHQEKKRKTNGTAKGKKKAAAKEKKQIQEYDEDVPVYISTQKPNAPMIHSATISKYAVQTWWKISSDVEVQASPILPGQGTVKTYNLTQMNPNWIKTLIKNLKDVAQIKCSVRGWKKTLLYCLCQANMPDNTDLAIKAQIAELEQQRKHGKGVDAVTNAKLDALEKELDEWEPRWFNEPLYELAMIEEVFQNTNIVIVRLTSTHGNFFIRTRSEFRPWMDFVNWIDVVQKNMIGYKSRRGGKEWNGYEVAEHSVSSDPEVTAQVTEMEHLFETHSCVAIWRTVEYNSKPT